MALLKFKDLSGKITHVLTLFQVAVLVMHSSKSLRTRNARCFSFWLYINRRALTQRLTAFSAFHLTRMKRNRSSTIFGRWKQIESLITPWSASAWPSRTLAISPMLSSEVTTQLKLSAATKVSKPSWTIQTGSKRGHSKDRDFSIMEWQFRIQKNSHSQQSLTLAAHSCRYRLTSSANWRPSGRNKTQDWIVKALSAIHKRHAQSWRSCLIQLNSNSVITYSKWDPVNTSTLIPRNNAVISWFTGAHYQARMQTCTLSVMCS